jgi:hypothetical protein
MVTPGTPQPGRLEREARFHDEYAESLRQSRGDSVLAPQSQVHPFYIH